MFSTLSTSTFSDSWARKVSLEGLPKRKKKSSYWTGQDGIFSCADDAHIRIDTTAGNGEYGVDIHVRENEKSDLLACTPNHWSNGLMTLFCDLATFPMVRFGSFFFYLKVHFPRVM